MRIIWHILRCICVWSGFFFWWGGGILYISILELLFVIKTVLQEITYVMNAEEYISQNQQTKIAINIMTNKNL